MYSEFYVRVILALAPLMVCLAFSLDRIKRRSLWLGISSAFLFGAAVLFPPFAVWGSLPWMLFISWRAVVGLLDFRKRPHRRTGDLAILASTLYLPVGGVWALFDQLHFQPLGFSGIIVLLTGVHFHYAGFALPRLTGLWLKARGESPLRVAATWGVILGVPLVAVGITTSQLSMPTWIETVSVSILAVSAFVVSVGQAEWALRTPMGAASRALFLLGGLALAAGMVLATIYGWRAVFPVAWATIPAMYAVHGTLNSLGFCLPGFLAWKVRARASRREE